MGKQYTQLADTHIQFIAEQKIFFIGTATADSRVNVSPKGMDSLRVLSDTRVIWLNVTGSGNETSAHVQENPRITIMFCAFEGSPMILRLYGSTRVIHPYDPDWSSLFPLFNPLPGARQIFDVTIDLVQTSCGMGVPYFSYADDRTSLSNWAIAKGEAGLERYWIEKNQTSIDGIATHIIDKRTHP
ncbi:MAG: pyridoxamine 5'-phosphate oxidase family protein [Sulfuriferula sp.]